VKYTFLSKWTVLLMTIVAIVLVFLGVGQLTGTLFAITFTQHAALGVVAILIALLIYVLAWFIALLDSVQERRWGWTILLVLLAATGLGPLVYSLLGPRNTK
jgi:hypothetical protein